jgi:hypothetical protein
MARKALLIGSQTGGLTGVDNDIDAMAAALDVWGFLSGRCEGAAATRAGIIDACERLIADARPEDAVFVYYSGHGGYCRQRETAADGRPREAMQFIVPFDFEESNNGDFRGIMASELSALFGRLTGQTRNVTVALDCCHSAHMARDGFRPMVPRALARPVSYDTVAAHFESLERVNGRLGAWLHESNPYSVRIVACSPDQSAYEMDNAAGVRTGLLTEALTKALIEARSDGLRVSWATVVDRVRQQVLSFNLLQRPEAEGPAQRLLFDTAEADRIATLPVHVDGDRVELVGAPLLGVRVGDGFTVMPAESVGPDDDTKIGDVEVEEVEGTVARGSLKLRDASMSVPLGARAYQRSAAAQAMPVRLPGSGTAAMLLNQAIGQMPILRPAGDGETCPVEVVIDDDHLTIVDQVGALLPPATADPAGIEQVTRNLKRLAWADRLRRMTADPAHELGTPIEVELGIVDDGQAERLPVSGAVIYVGQRIYIRVRNGGNERVYVSLLDIGVSSRVSVLNQASPSGEAVEPGEAYTLGWNVHRRLLEGQPVSWPDAIARSAPRPETVVVLVTAQPLEIYGLEQDGVRWKSRRLVEEGPRSPLEQVLDQIDHGASREIASSVGSSAGYTVRTIDFDLVPTTPPVAENAAFEVDERPGPSMLLWAPPSAVPTSVVARLLDFAAHGDHALPNAGLRLDVMALTRGPGTRPVWSAHTARFSIEDGKGRSLDELPIYHGPVADYLDLAVWLTRDSPGSLALAQLLRERITDNEIQLAVDQVGLTATSQAALATAAIAAGAVFINTAYHLLRRVAGEAVGLYRTTLLPQEGFGVGRPAEQCRIRAREYSFSCVVEGLG